MNTAINTTSGLNLISTQTLSGAASIVFTNLTPGKQYRIVSAVNCSTNNIGLYGRFREGSTDKTSSYLSTHIGWVGTTANNFADTGWFALSPIGNQASNKQTFSVLDYYIYDNGTAAYLTGTSTGADSSAANTPRHVSLFSNNVGMSACNGITLYPTGGTLTGWASLYEYKK
jgi:hypothetical protein